MIGRVEGFDELIAKLDKMGAAGNTVANRALKAGAEIIVAQQKKDGFHRTGAGANELSVGSIRTAKASKNKYVQIGIGKGTSWDNVRGVYFQHHGYHNTRNGRYYAGSLWMDKSFNKVKNAAAAATVAVLKKELGV